jgi:hypothetical protein
LEEAVVASGTGDCFVCFTLSNLLPFIDWLRPVSVLLLLEVWGLTTSASCSSPNSVLFKCTLVETDFLLWLAARPLVHGIVFDEMARFEQLAMSVEAGSEQSGTMPPQVSRRRRKELAEWDFRFSFFFIFVLLFCSLIWLCNLDRMKNSGGFSPVFFFLFFYLIKDCCDFNKRGDFNGIIFFFVCLSGVPTFLSP